jgi:hypothetical protein
MQVGGCERGVQCDGPLEGSERRVRVYANNEAPVGPELAQLVPQLRIPRVTADRVNREAGKFRYGCSRGSERCIDGHGKAVTTAKAAVELAGL